MEIPVSIQNCRLFRGISEARLAALLESPGVSRRAFRRGETLLRQGQQVRGVSVVTEGCVQILREDFWGGRSIVGLAEQGDIFGEAYAVSGQPLEVSALAATDGAALILSAESVEQAGLTANLLGMMAEKNLQLTSKIRHMSQRTTREKLLSYLSAQAQRAGEASFTIPLDRQQLADYLAVERSAMSAELSKLRKEGILKFQKNHFCLLQGGSFEEEIPW